MTPEMIAHEDTFINTTSLTVNDHLYLLLSFQLLGFMEK